MTTQRTLKKWRSEALVLRKQVQSLNKPFIVTRSTAIDWADRILKLTQELMDQSLISEKEEGDRNETNSKDVR